METSALATPTGRRATMRDVASLSIKNGATSTRYFVGRFGRTAPALTLSFGPPTSDVVTAVENPTVPSWASGLDIRLRKCTLTIECGTDQGKEVRRGEGNVAGQPD